uniref:Uncharacterized protein n=1 Tax=Spongospora subterranea TaxID=70186 RepID=A0A0H5QUJ0_9EUKA|eukprot:CRZ05241.1 hypothetical protein [Spongospora subterranea]
MLSLRWFFFVFMMMGAAQAATGIMRRDDDDDNTATTTTCVLTVPELPSTSKALGTPWMVSGCNQYDPKQTTFVEAVIYDPAAKSFSVYSPLVIDASTKVGVTPTPPVIPNGAIVGLWMSSNNGRLQLNGTTPTTLANNHCVNGLGNSLFGSIAYCNAVEFFAAAKVTMPKLITAADGGLCVTTRDFVMTDKDQSDNVYTTYLIDTAAKTIAQNTASNREKMTSAVVVANGDDTTFLQTMFVTLKCPQNMATSLTELGQMVPALALDELQGTTIAQPPVAIVPDINPDTLVDGQQSLEKRNLYRLGVDQSINFTGDGAEYCRHYVTIGTARMLQMKSIALMTPPPDPTVADSLHTFQCRKFISSFEVMKCADRLNIVNPVMVNTTQGGVVNHCTIKNDNGVGGGGSQAVASASTDSFSILSVLMILTISVVFTI